MELATDFELGGRASLMANPALPVRWAAFRNSVSVKPGQMRSQFFAANA